MSQFNFPNKCFQFAVSSNTLPAHQNHCQISVHSCAFSQINTGKLISHFENMCQFFLERAIVRATVRDCIQRPSSYNLANSLAFTGMF